MDIERRSVLKASGIAALASVTGLAGCSGLLGGSTTPRSSGSGPEVWQYDPSVLGVGSNTFFGSLDYGSIYQNRQYLPEDTRRSLEQTGSTSPVSPKEIDYMSGVAGADVSMMEQSGTGAGSVALTGSFDKSTITNRIQQEGSQVTEAGSYEGYTLYRSPNASEQFGPQASGSAMVAVGDGAVVVGAAFASRTSTSATGEQAVKTAIDSSMGNARRLRGNDQYATTVANTLGGGTVQFGGVADPELISQYAEMAAPQVKSYTKGLRAGGMRMNIQGPTTVFTVAIVYKSAKVAKDTGIAALVKGFAPRIEKQQEGINKVTASQNGNVISITIEGDTQTLFQQAGSTAPTGGF